jgi:hypothetical protein
MTTRPPLSVQVADPTYGPALDPREGRAAVVRTDVEPVPWGPRTPPAAPPGTLVFVDGIQQVEAWISVTPEDDPRPLSGVAFAVGAGAVTADGVRAEVRDLRIRRAIVTEGERCLHLPRVGAYAWDVRAGAGREPTMLVERVAAMRREMEHDLAERWTHPERLVVLDGRLSYLRDGRGPVIGAVKSHHAMYLEGDAALVVAQLRVGQRTPLFAVGDDRFSWYQRLPNVGESGWAGILRGEVSRAFGLETARRLADRAAAALPRYAGRPHRDPRAPQNLQPIAALESRLRHRLGDRRLAFRAVRMAAARAEIDVPAAGRGPLRVVA